MVTYIFLDIFRANKNKVYEKLQRNEPKQNHNDRWLEQYVMLSTTVAWYMYMYMQYLFSVKVNTVTVFV